LCLALFLVARAAAETGEPSFTEQTVDDKVQIGYGVDIGDVDGDGRPDILQADKQQFVWYQNPSWEKHVLAENLTRQDNVCIAARDIDGDGKVEIAVGGEWNPSDTVASGAVFYLEPPQDRKEPWRPIKLENEPVVHRMRWVKLEESAFALVVSPLHGRGNRNGEGVGVKLIAYHKPADPNEPWKTEVLEDTLHVTHNLDPCQWIEETPSEEILYLGREGAMLLAWAGGAWTKHPIPRVGGGGEIRMGLHAGKQPFVATIEPFHGDKLVYYPSAFEGEGVAADVAAVEYRLALGDKIVLDDKFNQGHAIATGDLFGDGGQEIVAGWRNANRDGKVGLKVYYPIDATRREWHSAWIDENGMATEDARIGDLNGDGLPEIVAAGRDTHNLKIYWNNSKRGATDER
jgi:hypothetical protein